MGQLHVLDRIVRLLVRPIRLSRADLFNIQKCTQGGLGKIASAVLPSLIMANILPNL